MVGRKTITLNVLNQMGVVLYGEFEAVFIPTSKGETAIMAFHTPAIMLISAGEIKVRSKHKIETVVPIQAGVAYVGENEVVLLINK